MEDQELRAPSRHAVAPLAPGPMPPWHHFGVNPAARAQPFPNARLAIASQPRCQGTVLVRQLCGRELHIVSARLVSLAQPLAVTEDVAPRVRDRIARSARLANSPVGVVCSSVQVHL